MAKDSRELIKYNKMFLDDIGINYSYNYEIIDFAADKGYVKLDKDSAAKLDMAIQYIPDLLLNSELYKGTYRVVFDKELGNLQKAANNPGLFRANIVKEGTNNVITGQALLQEVSAVPQIVGNVFAVASVVTGQYYMEQINKKLEKIEKTAQDILAFLENDKRSKIESQIEFLLNVQKNYQ